VASSLPIVTLGASLTALNFAAMRIATGKSESVMDDYFRSFRRNFRQATVAGLIIVLMTVVLAAWYVVVPTLSVDPITQLIFWAIWYVLAFNFAMMVLFVFPYLASFDGRTRDVFRNARLMSWKHPFTALAALAIIVLSATVTAFYPQVTGYGILWLAIGFAGIATVNGSMFARVFNSYVAAAASAAGKK
jgi:uncharacterized membrane protein YesL